MDSYSQDFHSQAPCSSPTPGRKPPSGVSVVFIGPTGLRAGWRLVIFLAILIACLAGFRELLVHTASLARLLQPLREGRLSVPVTLTVELAFVVSLLIATIVMAKIETRSLSDYGLPIRDAFGRCFWQGVTWGLAAITGLILLIYALGGFSFGSLALTPAGMAGYAAGWALVFLMVGFFEEYLFRGFAQFTLATGIGFWPAAVLLSAVFGFVHLGSRGESWVGGVSAGLFGLFLCLTLRRTGNLWFALGLHSGFIYGETFVYSVPNSGFLSMGHLLNSSLHGPQWLTGGSVGPEASVMIFAVLALLFVSFDRFYRQGVGVSSTQRPLGH
jgi:uncharacterized protein